MAPSISGSQHHRAFVVYTRAISQESLLSTLSSEGAREGFDGRVAENSNGRSQDQKLYDSIPRRIEAVLKAKGGPTSY